MPQSYNFGYVADGEEGGAVAITLKRKDSLVDVTSGEGKEFNKPLEKDDLDNKISKVLEKTSDKPKGATLRELFSFATGPDVVLIIVGTLASVAHGAAWPVLTLSLGDMMDDFINYSKNISMATFEDNMSDYALRYVYIAIGVAITAYVQMTFWQLACERQTHKLRRAFFKALLRQSISWFDQQQSGNLTTKLADDLERIREGIGDKVSLAIQFAAQFLCGFLVAFSKGWKMTLVLMAFTPLLTICVGLFGKLNVNYSALEQLSYSQAGAVAEEAMSCIRTVTSFNGQAQEIKRYVQSLAKCKKMGIRKALFTGLSHGSTLLVTFCTYGLGFWFATRQVDEHNESGGQDGYSPGTVITIFICVIIGSFSLGHTSPHIAAFVAAKGAAGVIFPILKAKPPIDASKPTGKKPASITGNIQLKNVAFSYSTRPDAQILQDLNLSIDPGLTVALVGASGCGKSTIVNLIQRFYDPDRGTVQLDGVDIRDLNICWLRENIGIVSQEPILFGMSIAQNIQLGHPGISMEEVERAAKMANAHDFIKDLPEGYNTLAGERGAQLSGGQKQRVAIARALVRDPRILLLDEATSALDSESEAVVQAALDKAGKGRTTVVIAHRLSTIQNADLICVMERGAVVERGKHGELMARKGAYYNLVTLQMIAEKDDDDVDYDDDVAVGEENELVVERDDETRPQGCEVRPRKRTLSHGTKSAEKNRRRLSSQPSDQSPTKKRINFFRRKRQGGDDDDDDDESEKEEGDLAKPGFGRIFKSNLKEWPFILAGCLAAVINGLIFPAFAYIYSEIINSFTKVGDELLDDGLMWSMMFISLGGLAFFSSVIQHVSFGLSGERLTHRLRTDAFRNIVRQDIEYFDNPKHSTGALITRLATDATLIKMATGMHLAMVLQAVATLVAGLVIAFVFGWKLTLALLAGTPLYIIAGMINLSVLKRNQERDSVMLEEAGKTASESMENIRTVQGLTREAYFFDAYSDQLAKPYKENIKQAHVYGLSYAFSQGIIFFIYAGAFRFGAWLVAHDGMRVDLVFRVFMAITMTGISVGNTASSFPLYAKAQKAATKIFHILDMAPKIDIFDVRGAISNCVNGDIHLKDVHFRYPTRPDVTILNSLSMRVLPGQTAALVGMSGCGKSTIISLIQRYYDPDTGTITVDGGDVRDYKLKSLRSFISVVSQEPVLFDATIKENIVYGQEEDVPMQDIIQAARTANAHDFITQLPDGYNTSVGEKGAQLSGGQKQRIAIARALVRNPKILLLDETTSALDTESEKIVQAALDKAREGRTCIVIAHRLSTIQNTDIIYVIEGGRVIESGTHQELLIRKGAYSILVGAQQLKKGDGDAGDL